MQGVGKQINSRVVREENLGDEIIKMIMISVNICCGFFPWVGTLKAFCMQCLI